MVTSSLKGCLLAVPLVVALADGNDVVFDLHRPLHMADVVRSLVDGTHTKDHRTTGLMPEQALTKLRLSTPCGWFWHSKNSGGPELAAPPLGSFLDKGALSMSGAGSPMALNIVRYEEPIELRHHSLFGTQVPIFNGLEHLTPHSWNFVPALKGSPGAVSLESAAFPGYFVHHVLSPQWEQSLRTYQLMMSHQSEIEDHGDAEWIIGRALGKYDVPVMVTFKSANLDVDHHIVHTCARDSSPHGHLHCNLVLAPRIPSARFQAHPAAQHMRQKLHTTPRHSAPHAASDESGFQVMREKVAELSSAAESAMVHLGSELGLGFGTVDDVSSTALSEEQMTEDNEGHANEQAEEAATPLVEPEVKDFDNASAFYVHDLA